MNRDMTKLHKKTPTVFSGLKPEFNDNFEESINNWTRDEKILYMMYLERDTIKFNMIYGLVIGILIGIFLGVIGFALIINL